MSLGSLAQLYGLTAGVFFAVDVIWIGGVAAGFYRESLGHLLRNEVLWVPALAFYAIYIAGILVFAVIPGLEAVSFTRALTLGAFLGLIAYATFDLTAMALLRGFPGKVAVVDIVWGVVLTGSVSAAGYGIGRWLGVGG